MGQHLRLSQGMLGEVRVRLSVRSRDQRTIAKSPHLRVALAAHGPLDNDVSVLVLIHGQAGITGLGTIPAARTIVSASIVLSGKWTLPGSMARTGAWTRISAPRRPPKHGLHNPPALGRFPA